MTTLRSPSNKGSKQTDPVAELRFKVELTTPSGPIGRFQEVTGLAAELEVKEYPEGGMNDFVHKLPTRVKWPNIVLKRGVTKSDNLFGWLNKTSGEGFAGAGDKLELNFDQLDMNSVGAPTNTRLDLV